MIRIFEGLSALSQFRKNKLLVKAKAISKNVKSLEAKFLHILKLEKQLSENQEEIIKSLLNYNKEYGVSNPCGTKFIVAPRVGTISPWSSKATDIIHNTGILSVKRVERAILYGIEGDISTQELKDIQNLLHDRMVEEVFANEPSLEYLFKRAEPKPIGFINVLEKGEQAIKDADKKLGLALSEQEISYLAGEYVKLSRNPTDTELYMFAQANSEHCRHKIFNAKWTIDGQEQDKSLFKMIKNTTQNASEGVLSAYKDNAAVIEGTTAQRFYTNTETGIYGFNQEEVDILMKVETHNHPTAIAPFSGSATGVGGEIRDEGATGLGAKPKAGLTGFCVSNLNILNFEQPWEAIKYGKPEHIVTPLQIMLEAPIGGAHYSNEFGRPNLCGYFRTYEQLVNTSSGKEMFGYHKPIMIAGGMGNIKRMHVEKGDIKVGAKLICLGGPAMRIGLGGGAASSVVSSDANSELDFASVQRDNAEMERRCQEVIDKCWQMGEKNPITFIHDVGAGGISNAFPELVKDGNVGGHFELRKVLVGEEGLSPLEIWSNESQERYVLSVDPQNLEFFENLCKRERCPFAIVGEAISEKHITLNDEYFDNKPVDLPMGLLFGNTPQMHIGVKTVKVEQDAFDASVIKLDEAIERVLKVPAVASKSFLITIGDRSITGMVARDQMVGPWQVPVADCAVTTATVDSQTGEAMAMGERTPVGMINAAASGRLAIAETVTNLLAADIKKLSDIRLSANWMVAANQGDENQKLYETVKAVGMEFAPELGIAIPVGKDSMSMKTKWSDNGKEKSVTSPLSLVISGFSPVANARKTLTPVLAHDNDTNLLHIDLSNGAGRLGASCLAQAYNQVGNIAPDVEASKLKVLFENISKLKAENKILAYHDVSDGGVFVTLAEMSFAGRKGLDIKLQAQKTTVIPDSDPESQSVMLGNDSILAKLFAEEVGVVIQVKNSDVALVEELFKGSQIHLCAIAKLNSSDEINIFANDEKIYSNTRINLQKWWAETSYNIQSLRDNSECAKQEFDSILNTDDKGIHVEVTFDLEEDITAKFINIEKPKVAILREQGVNGHVEMAAAFTTAGFETHDVHMSDLHASRVTLDDFKVLVACGGFSYGDVLGAGGGWAKNILFTEKLRDEFSRFFGRDDTLALGVCNGCQMLAQLKSLIPGAENWPIFIKNKSEQFEARTSMVEIRESDSIWLAGMTGTKAPIAVAHGEGRPLFENDSQQKALLASSQVALKYIDGQGKATEVYPYNPNGAIDGLTAVTALDGRVLAMMPHPERVYRAITNSYIPAEYDEYSVWMRMFRNARTWVG
ncbi:phosphoribosylformylglycinamidine synthase [Allofrancisella guangzhouensis]|uniref:Phosphoribosylformylglycinamidine synthase n=1 Tax=Allofrancisella guangzhouensis TaxID=594679 RepID=A0A0A8E4E7_9GAMM|nr:phosphoribosylformylglycinamidine synthase [Allofrancisella guangzhouensis]AJC48477.1 phosphoribosylformylglycinamidine synthase [Allofrancisella guangzhouensis]MBK2044067.1 phosphoribosylformylglycinamidine synthase [Allofrancisella guangzhouensis]MBK2046515.1 phosphoribosylformylglycinamidine synthase [Allofrancisella guangzhouensis]